MLIARLDLQGGTADFSGSFLDLPNAMVRKGDHDPASWSGHLTLSPATVRRPEGLVLTAHAEASAPDAGPLFSLLNLDVPRWWQRVLSMKDFTAAADVTLGPELVGVKSLDATGKGSRVQGQYHRKGKAETALCLVEAGPLALGVSTSEGKTRMKYLFARTWYRKELAASGTPSPARDSSETEPKTPARQPSKTESRKPDRPPADSKPSASDRPPSKTESNTPP